MQHFITICRWIESFVSFGANAVTLALGVFAIWTLIFHKRDLELLVDVLLSSFLNERVKRVKETLGKLESLSHDNKEDRPEIVALLGQVSGQIKPFISDDGDLAKIHEELLGIVARRTRLTEATKRRVVYEMHGALDGLSYAKTRAIMESKK